MKSFRMIPAVLTACVALVLTCAVRDASAAYPDRPIKIIAPFAAGGPADFLARLLGNGLAARLNATVIVENKPGAGGNIGAAAVAKAEPDGYTLLLGYMGTLAINPSLYQKQLFDPVKDFAPISMLATNPLVLVTRAGLGVNTMQELIARAKSGNGLTYGSGGIGSANHLAAELFKSATGIKLVHVPYQGVAPATTALIGGQIDMMFNGVSVSLPHVKSGAMKALAVSTASRVPSLPDVKTVAEAGIPGYDVSAWFGLLAPSGTPPAILQQLEQATRETMMSQEVASRLDTVGLQQRLMGQAEFGKFIKAELKTWSKVVRDAGVRAD